MSYCNIKTHQKKHIFAVDFCLPTKRRPRLFNDILASEKKYKLPVLGALRFPNLNIRNEEAPYHRGQNIQRLETEPVTSRFQNEYYTD